MNIEALRLAALSALYGIANDPDAPASARASVARTLLEAIGDIGRGSVSLRDKDLRDLSELSPEELQAEIERDLANTPMRENIELK
jgi:hypothetical protein